MNIRHLFGLSLLISVGFGCGQKSDSMAEAKQETAQTVTGPQIQGVPEAVMQRLLDECTYVDYIFHKLPFSLSQSEDPSIDQNILYIDYNRPLKHIPEGCVPIGRKFFLIKGESAYDVDIYLSNQCKFYVFVDKANKPVFANYMTEEGVKFYANVAQQARAATQQPQ
jgi:hypothetical protein